MAHKYGPIFSLRLETKLHVVVNTMDLVKVVVRDLDHNFANRDPPLTALSITYGRIGTGINVNKVAYDTEIDVVTNLLWGCSKGYDDYGKVGDEFQEVAFEIMKLLAAPNISDFILMLSRFDLQGRERDMRKLKEQIDRIFENAIRGRINANSRKMGKDERKDFLQALLYEKDDPKSSLDMDQIKAILVSLGLVGSGFEDRRQPPPAGVTVGGGQGVDEEEKKVKRNNRIRRRQSVLVRSCREEDGEYRLRRRDTTATMVEWVMAEILYNPRVMTKIQEELGDVIGLDNIVEESHLSKLIYLDAVIKETFRLQPAVPLLIPRCPDESCTVGGYTIPMGIVVFINAWATHRDPKNWTNPLEFNPERFLNTKLDYKGNSLKFLPFGSGRICPGAPSGGEDVDVFSCIILAFI
ncbi:hypothetical protein OSB04_029433 [Centaurea solstitialis]|uniref:Cytochrome P450 n=1 Tax=Centaurea solstitialis TaxID=347529 RepID=A0AA38W1J4_9ASTR|nr:hypothetical protein OSB04_029433 [Centaurea solstitialis]